MQTEIIGYIMVKDLCLVDNALLNRDGDGVTFEDAMTTHSDANDYLSEERWVGIGEYPRALDRLQDAGLISEDELKAIVQEEVTILLFF